MSWNANVIGEFRNNHGHVGGSFRGKQLLLLHTTGRRSGAERVNPLAYLRDGDRFAVFGSMGGADTHPQWVLNVEANPDVEIEVGDERIKGRATVLWDGPERDRIYAEQVKVWSQFGDYERKTSRTIPVVVIEPVG